MSLKIEEKQDFKHIADFLDFQGLDTENQIKNV